MANLPRLIVPLALQAKAFTKGINDAIKRTKSFQLKTNDLGKSINSLKRLAVAGFAGWGLARLTREMIVVGATFENSMKTVGAVTRATGKQFVELEKTARKMGATTEFTASQAAEGLKFLGMAGFGVVKSIAVLPGVLDLATASQIDLGRAADITTNALTAMGLATSEIDRVNDAFIGTITRTNTNMEMMAESFKYSAPLAKAYGTDIETLSAMIGILGNAGVQGSMAGTQLAFSFQRVGKVFEGLGIDGTGKDLIDALEAVNEAGLGTNEVMKLFGMRGGRAALIMKDMIPQLRELRDELRANGGETKKLADIMRSSLVNQYRVLVSVIQDKVLDLFNENEKSLKNLVVATTNWIKEMGPSVVETINLFAGAIKGVAEFTFLLGSGLGITAGKIADFADEVSKHMSSLDFGDMITFDADLNKKREVVVITKKITGQIVSEVDKANKKIIGSEKKKTKTIKSLIEKLPDISEDAWKEMAKNAEDAFKAERFASEVATEDWVENEIEKMEASEKLYKELQEQAEGWEAFSVGSTENLLEDSTIAYEGFFGGIKQGFQELKDSQKKWVDHGRESILAFASDAKAGLSSFINPLKDDFLNVSTLFSSMLDSMVGSLTDAVADMAVQWGMDQAAKAGSALLGTVAGAAASEAGSSLWDAAKEYLKLSSGAWDVKKDQFAFLHEGEMVLPPTIAESYRSAEGGVDRAPPGGWTTMPANTGQFAEGTFGAMAMNAMSGMQVPGASLSGVLPGVGLKGVVGFGQNLAMQELGLTGKWAEVGDFLGSFFGGIKGGQAGAFMGGIAGAGFFDALGDVSNLRGHEALRDALEDTYGRVSAGKMVAASGLLTGDVVDSLGLLAQQMQLTDAYAASPFAGDPYTGGHGFITGKELGGYSSDIDYGGGGGGGMSGWGKHGGWLHGPDSGHPATLHGSELILNEDQVKAVRELNAGGGTSGPIHMTFVIGGLEFEAYVQKIADGVRVKAEKAGLGSGERAYF